MCIFYVRVPDLEIISHIKKDIESFLGINGNGQMFKYN